MPIDFRNTNTLWASILVETLYRLGLKVAILCPGSRSTPLTLAFATHAGIEAVPVLDERSAGFFALGIAKKSGLPVVLVCTSGTAGANFYPAIIEAKESRIPLIILTADRPPELRECHSGQTIDQVKLYGHYPNWQTEISLPAAEISLLNYLRQTLIYAWERSLFPVVGAVHLNCPFRDPLAPTLQPEIAELEPHFEAETFFENIHPFSSSTYQVLLKETSQTFLNNWLTTQRGIIIAGVAQPQNPEQYCESIAKLSHLLGWPVLAEGLSPVRNYAALNSSLISTYDLILRNAEFAETLKPEIVIQIGEFPTSKELRNFIISSQSCCFLVDSSYYNLDPLHQKTIHLKTSIENITQATAALRSQCDFNASFEYLKTWCEAETQMRKTLDQTLETLDWPFEGKAAWILSQILPANTPLFIANSMPVRDVEFFWKPNNLNIQPYFNRGANGIDGTLSTALGIAHHNQSSVMLTGDLAFLHDTNGLLLHNKLAGHLTILLINNNGGGIFEMLPISQFDPPFEEFFATPQVINIEKLCESYHLEYQRIESWQQLKTCLNPLPNTGIRILELRTNRKKDAHWRKETLGKLAQTLQ
jgi:2-succinyl-5-enolpyruvyl-6-hydroxy-3-cyclohexene-1-carboxylate synthase